MTFTTHIKEDENGYFVELPDEILRQMGISENDELDMYLLEECIVVRKPEKVETTINETNE